MESNVGLLITYTITLLIMIGLPIALAFFVVKKFKVSWWVILTGVVTFIVSQCMYYPVLQKISALFNNGTLSLPSTQWMPLFNAVILGFLAALFEESARYFGFLVIRKKVKRIKSAVGLGIGHGGFESLTLALWPFWPIFGGLLIQFATIVFYNPATQLANGISSDQVQYYLSAYAQFWQNPWHLGLLYGAKILISLSTQVLLSILVWKAIRYRKFWWFLLAFFYHLLITGIEVFLSYNGWGYWAVNGILSIFMLANLYLIYYFWKEEADRAKEKELESGTENDDAETEAEGYSDEDVEEEEVDDDEFDDDDEFEDEYEEEDDVEDEEDEEDSKTK